MKPPTSHPAYDEAVAHARRLADENPKSSVFLQLSQDKTRIRVDLKERDTWDTFAIAQVWDDKTIQLRTEGATSEWLSR